jgi:ubiquitin carboxyl-terminal hydrolase 25/28
VRACVFALGYYFRSDGDISSSDALQSFDFYSVAAAATGGIRTPVGLFNIGNTCYLNSILQLLFSCSVIHEILMDHHATYLSLTNHDLSNRRIGGNCIPLDRCEGIIGQVFFSELHALFSRLKAAEDGIAIKPSQLLANSALISTTQLLKSSKSRQDLGTCPDGSLSSHTPYSHRIVSANLPADPQTIPPQPLSPDESYGPPPGQGQVASSCQTDRLSDLSTTEAEATLKMCLNNHSRTSGTEQQDFEEVHGRILNLIQASIAPLRTTDGVQWDSIMDTFYVEVANYTANNTGLVNTEVVLDRYITAFPAKSESCTLYQALDRNFDRHGIEGSQSIRWSSIRQPSPMLNILIQRSQAGGMKNMNEVAIPDVLDISRYMDLPPRRNRPGPDGWNVLPARYRAWCINSRVERLQQIKAAFAAPVTAVSQAYVASHLNILESVGDTSPAFVPHHSSMASLMSTRLFEVDGVHDSQSPTLSEVFIETQKDDMRRPSVVTSSDMPSFALPAINVVAPQVDNTIEALITSKESLLGSVSKVDAFDVSDTLFHLHAVICHSGGMNAGHYWIWIKDHDRNVWRKYNDAHVTEHSAEEALGSLGGDPCYLCFVRARDRERFVYTSP